MGSSPQLRPWLEKTFADAGGRLPFEKFMQLALYDSDFGYYTANIQDVGGSRADFATWTTLTNLGRPVARWIRDEIAFHQWQKQPVSLIEVGAGDGSLAAGILNDLGWRTRRKITLHIVEISGPLRQIQGARLKKYRVRWHKTMDDAIAASEGQAILYSNELVDAFPVRWLRWDGEKWQEIHVAFSPEKGLREEFSPYEGSLPEWENPPAGQRIERHDSYLNWLDSWLPDFKKGSILTIDYGGTDLREIYAKRIEGTVRGYFRQQRIERSGIYRRFGKQDLTCDVDFQRLTAHGESNNLETVSLENLYSFFQRHGVEEIANREAAEAFCVLHQRRG